MMKDPLDPTDDPAWVLVSRGYDPLRENVVESRFAISNGFLGLRGGRSTTRGARRVVSAGTYVAGLFDHGEGEVPMLTPAADWLRIRIFLADDPLVHHPGDVSLHHMTLDMKRGLLLSTGHHAHAPGLKARVHTLRLVSTSQRSVGLQIIQCEIESGTTEITLEASIEGTELGLVTEQIDHNLGVWRTHQSAKRLAMATTSALHVDGRKLLSSATGPLMTSWRWRARPGQVALFERLVAISRREAAASSPAIEARNQLRHASQIGWRGVLEAHEEAWLSRWSSSDIEVAGDENAQRALRFAIYHLNSAANPADETVSIGARALTGEEYRGHIFWDTEIFLLPFYSWTWPEAARSLLMYRFHTLEGARAKARVMGWRGALYAWESADTGAETTPEEVVAPDGKIVKVLCGKQEQHISAAVAYAVWQYWQTTGDEEFLCEAGAEIILETARFWASRAQVESDGRHHIRGVIGPDEYHEGIDDNAYTNLMARWNIRRALDLAAFLPIHQPESWARLSEQLGLNGMELRYWQDVADTIATGFDPRTALFEQFAGYFTLENLDLSSYAGRSVPMDMVLGHERTQRSQVIKQADVIMLLALLPEEFSPDLSRRNFDYYQCRCGHGSSLSSPIHGLVAARLGDIETALRYFERTAAIDLADTQVTSDRGVHIAALGGIWLIAVFGFGGLSIRGDDLAFEPHLPAGWCHLAFAIHWRGRRIKILVRREQPHFEAALICGEPVTLIIYGKRYTLSAEEPLSVLDGGDDGRIPQG